MDHWITRFREATPIEGREKVLVPGDPERELTALRKENGIPLLPAVVKDLQGLAGKFDLKF